MLEEKYAQIAEEEIESVKERLSRRPPAHVTMNPDEFEDEEVRGQLRMVGHSSLNGTRTNEYNQVKRNYGLVGVGMTFDEDELAPTEEDDSVDPDKPYVITEESFSEEFLNHDKVTITYYGADDTLADEDGSIISDIDEIVGYDSLDMKNTGLTHPHTVFVRNERIGTDYEILINLGSYQEQVLGIMLSPREQQERRTQRRRKPDDDDE